MSTHESPSINGFGRLATPTTTAEVDTLHLAGCGSRTATERRIRTLKQIKEQTEIPKSELVTLIASLEEDCKPSGVDTAARRRVGASLTQTHLPALEDAGVIELEDMANGTLITLGPDAEETFERLGWDMHYDDSDADADESETDTESKQTGVLARVKALFT